MNSDNKYTITNHAHFVFFFAPKKTLNLSSKQYTIALASHILLHQRSEQQSLFLSVAFDDSFLALLMTRFSAPVSVRAGRPQ
jgi:hypothetical protein